MGSSTSSLQSTSRDFIIDQVTLKQGSESTSLQFASDEVHVEAQGGNSCPFKLKSMLEDPDPSNPTQWKSIQSLGRMSASALQRLRGRNLTLTVDYSEDLVVAFTFKVAGECPKGLVFVIGEKAEELQSVMAKIGSEVFEAIHESGNVIRPELVPIGDTVDGPRRYEWAWKYVAPPPGGDQKSAMLPPTGGWKNFCCFGEYQAEQKHFRVLSTFEFFMSSPMPPTVRLQSQSSFHAFSGHNSRRASPHNITEHLSLLSPHSEGNESASSPRSSISSPMSATVISPAQPNIGYRRDISLGHRRELSSGTASSSLNLEEVDDEPAFLHTIETLEKRTANLKHAVKKTNKEIMHYIDAGRAFTNAGKNLVESIGSIQNVDDVVVNVLREIQEVVEKSTDMLLQQVERMVLEQTDLVYRNQIKAAEGQKKIYDQEYKDFNSCEQKYLSIKSHDHQKKLLEVDSKWQEKRKNYELKRLDYYCHLRDLHGGQLERDLNFAFTVLADKQMSFYRSVADKLGKKKEDLDFLSNKWKELNEKYIEERREREERRKLIESKAQLFVDVGGEGALSDQDESPNRTGAADRAGSTTSKHRWFRDAPHGHDAESSALGRRRKGYLWVAADTKGPAQQLNWRKLWCVLQGGFLKEYNLKRNHTEEIHTTNMLRCSVKECHNIDRRFAFEIIGQSKDGKISKRIYQAGDAEDVKAWIAVINNSIMGWLSGTSTIFEATPEPGDPVGAKAGISPGSANWDNQGHEDAGALQCLEAFREADPGNSACAECGAKDPEWISINLGCIVCINCSGAHRNLGTHITKVRSLTLDTTWATPTLLTMLKSITNTTFNTIFEHRVPPDAKPLPTHTLEAKAQFIRDKYLQRTFAEKMDVADAMRLLYKAVAEKDIVGALRALAAGASINKVENGNRPLIVAALGYPSPPPPPRRHSSPTGQPPQPSSRLLMLEFLLQNGADLNVIDEVSVPCDRKSMLCYDKEGVWRGESGAIVRRMAAIHYAALYHDVEALEALLTRREPADVLTRDAFDNSPLELVEIGRKLLAESDDPDRISEAARTCEDLIRQTLLRRC